MIRYLSRKLVNNLIRGLSWQQAKNDHTRVSLELYFTYLCRSQFKSLECWLDGGMAENAIRLGQYEILKYSFGALLTCSDVATDILIATTYYQHHQYVWFSFCLAFAILPSFLLTLAYLLQRFRQETAITLVKRFLFFANPCGSGILKIKLLLVCLRHYDEVWSYQGWLVDDEKLRQDYRAEKVYHYVEGLLENMPQMILQIYVTIIQDDKISDLQIFSISVTFVNLVWVLTLFEYSSFVKEVKLTHFTAIIFYNACLIAARGLSIVTFLVAFKWVTSAVLAFHEFVCISIYLYRNHDYFTEKEVWWIACLLMPCYIFVYLGFKVKELNSKFFDIKLGRSIVSSSLFYFCFITENVLMVSLFFTWSTASDSRWDRWISKVITVTVIVLSILGTIIQLIFTFVFFRKPLRVRPYEQEIPRIEAHLHSDNHADQSESQVKSGDSRYGPNFPQE